MLIKKNFVLSYGEGSTSTAVWECWKFGVGWVHQALSPIRRQTCWRWGLPKSDGKFENDRLKSLPLEKGVRSSKSKAFGQSSHPPWSRETPSTNFAELKVTIFAPWLKRCSIGDVSNCRCFFWLCDILKSGTFKPLAIVVESIIFSLFTPDSLAPMRWIAKLPVAGHDTDWGGFDGSYRRLKGE